MCNTSLKSLFVISLHGMWFLDRVGRIKIRYGAKLGREGKEAVARLCHMETEQEQTKGNLDYFWMSLSRLLHNIPSFQD